MTGITHKQALRYLRAAADGLLHEDQRALLDAHLLECVSCRAEADELNALAERLKQNFEARWDAQDGPSQDMVATVRSQTGRIIMTNRISIGAKIFAGLVTLLLLGLLFSPTLKQLEEYSKNNRPVSSPALSATKEAVGSPTPPLTVQDAEALAGFHILVPSYLPAGYIFQGADYDSQSQIVILKYVSSTDDANSAGTISIYQKRGDFPQGPGPVPYATPVPVVGVTGEFTHGAWVYDSPDTTTPRWEGDNDYYALSWQKDSMSFKVDFLGGVLTPTVQLEGLTAIAEGLKSAETAGQIPSIGTDKSNGGWIAFASGDFSASGIPQVDVYLIHPDGNDLVNLTNAPANYSDLQWSPSGEYLSFLRQSENAADLIIVNPNDGKPINLTSFVTVANFSNVSFSWSPNSNQIIFDDNRNGYYDIYSINPDGSNLKQLTNDPGLDVGFVWSQDGSQIAYTSMDNDKLSIHVMNADGSNEIEVAQGTGSVKLHWSVDGQSIYATTQSPQGGWLECEQCLTGSAIYQINIDRQSIQQIFHAKDFSGATALGPALLDLYESPQNTVYFKKYDLSNNSATWMRISGQTAQEIGIMNPHHICNTNVGNYLEEYISPNEMFSVVSDTCAGETDLYLVDRGAATPEKAMIHLMRLPATIKGQGESGGMFQASWLPDGRWLMLGTDGNAIYLLNIVKALQDSTADPLLLFRSKNQLFEFRWQPLP